MKFSRFLGVGVIALAFVAGGAQAQDKAAKQAEVRKVAAATTQRNSS